MKIYPVSIVGAGPGDPDLLTIKAVNAIAQADVILMDALVNTAVLQHASKQCRIVPVGKRGGCASTPQAFIGKLLVREALAGHRVVRLKGGDPAVFARTAEELIDLRQAGLDWQIVPGITAASAAAAELGLPLTDRAHGHGIALVTGHAAEDSDVDPDWQALFQSGLTLAVYMGIKRGPALVAHWLKIGIKPQMPCHIVSKASQKDASTWSGVLSDLQLAIESGSIATPALLLVGHALKQQPVATNYVASSSKRFARK